MKWTILYSLLWCTAMASPFPSRHSPNASKPPFFVLAGDSTTARQSSGGGGWGDGFLNTSLFNGASGKNFGHNGATTVSFRSGGDWSQVLATVSQVKADYSPFVTIQFGHNDQKATANISLEEYTQNLEKFAAEAIDAGATPILVTPLSRRKYDNSTNPPQIILDLADQREATLQAASTSGVASIDLNKASTDYLNSIGQTDAWKYNLNPDDATHLNYEGSEVFGGLVATLIEGVFPSLSQEGFIKVNSTLEAYLSEGIFYWP